MAVAGSALKRQQSTKSAFGIPLKSSTFSRIQPPDLHQVCYATGGLAKLYQRIQNLGKDSAHAEESQYFTDEEGIFSPTKNVPLLAKRYRLVRSLGTGCSATLIQAVDTFRPDNYHVAIKVLNQEYYALGYQESNNIERLNHADPHDFSGTIRLLNTFSFDGHYCLVFELLHPKPLYHYFKRIPTGSKKLQLVRKVALRLLQVLGFLRQENIIHADLKPENILCRTEDLSSGVKVIDFGNAIHCVYDELSLYYDDFELQTLLYRAPEVVYGLPFGPEIDMWSVGCILAELYLGEPLFFAVTKEELLQKMVAVLGLLPVQIFQRGKFFAEFESFIGKPQPKLETQSKLFHRLGDLRDYNFGSFILSILQYNPSERISISDAFLHPFLAPEVAGRFLLPPSSNADASVYNRISIPASIYSLSPVVSSEVANDHLSSVDLLRRGTASIQSEPVLAKRPRRAVAEVAPFTPKQDLVVSDSCVAGEPVTDRGPGNAHQTISDIVLKEETLSINTDFMGLYNVATVAHGTAFSIPDLNLSFPANSPTTSSKETSKVQISVSMVQPVSKECTVNSEQFEHLRHSANYNSARNESADTGSSSNTNDGLSTSKKNSNPELEVTLKETLREPPFLGNHGNPASTSTEICIGHLASHIEKTIEAEYQQNKGLPHRSPITRYKHLEQMKLETLRDNLEKSSETTEDTGKWYQKSFREKSPESNRSELSVEVAETCKSTPLPETPRRSKRTLKSTPSHPQDDVGDGLNLLTPLSSSQTPESSTQQVKQNLEESTPTGRSRWSRRRLQDKSPDQSRTPNRETLTTGSGAKKVSREFDKSLSKNSKQPSETKLLSESVLKANAKSGNPQSTVSKVKLSSYFNRADKLTQSVSQASGTRRNLDRTFQSPGGLLTNPSSADDQYPHRQTSEITSAFDKKLADRNARKSLRLTSPTSSVALTAGSRVRKTKPRVPERIKAKRNLMEPVRWWELNPQSQREVGGFDVAENRTTVAGVTPRREVDSRNNERKDVSQIKVKKEGQSAGQPANIPSSHQHPGNHSRKTLIRKLTDSEEKSSAEDLFEFESSPHSSRSSSQSRRLKKAVTNVGSKSRTKNVFGKSGSHKLQKHPDDDKKDTLQAKMLQNPRTFYRKKSGHRRKTVKSQANLRSNRPEDSSKHTVNSKRDMVSGTQPSGSRKKSRGHTLDAHEYLAAKDGPKFGRCRKRKLGQSLGSGEEEMDARNFRKESLDEESSVRILPSNQPDSGVELRNVRVKGETSATCLKEDSNQQHRLSPWTESEMDTSPACSPSERLSSDNDDEVMLL